MSKVNSMHWFRKGLRIHDNPALIEALKVSGVCYTIFTIDPHFANPEIVGVNRYEFLLQSLADLDKSLRLIGLRLFVLRGKPDIEITNKMKEWDIKLLTFESDTEPYAKIRDAKISSIASSNGVKVSSHASHTLHDPERYLFKNKNTVPGSYQSFLNVFRSLPEPRKPIDNKIIKEIKINPISPKYEKNTSYNVPTLKEMGYPALVNPLKFIGGETEALRRMEEKLSNHKWVASFAKPDTSPNSLEASTTVLSPYLKFGCLSSSLFYYKLDEIYKKEATHSKPPVSLHGQMLFREFFYLNSHATPNFDKMIGNPKCKQINWERNAEKILAWKEARTGFPFIDAIMTQLRVEGWIHHLARHAVACFLTRGDLYQHWEEGAKVFDLYLLDSDWALNNANWQWLSCSNFFYQYFRCYSPVAFGKKTDPNGNYIRKWLPQLKNFKKEFIYEPWKAPGSNQKEWGCIIGKDYPLPIVDHSVVSQENMTKMKIAYAAGKSKGEEYDDDDDDEEGEKKVKKQGKKRALEKPKESILKFTKKRKGGDDDDE